MKPELNNRNRQDPLQYSYAISEKSSRVSVIIPTRNRHLYLNRAIQSVLNQTYPVSEIIVVDDGSEIAVNSDSLPIDPRIKVIRSNHSHGVSHARNTGIIHSNSEYLAFLDDDDIWMPNKTIKQLVFLEDNPEYGICAGGCVFIDENDTVVSEPDIREPEVSYQELCIRVSIPGSGSNAMIRKSVLNSTGLFDESLHRAEDWDLWLRIAKISKVYVLPETTAGIRIHSGFRRATNPSEILSSRLKVHSRIESHQLKRQAIAYTLFWLSSIHLSRNEFYLSSKYMIKSFYTWPFRLDYSENRLRALLRQIKEKII